jgi:hypothetical protein
VSAPPNRQYSRFIVTADLWPTTREACQAKAEAWQGAAEASSAAADAHRVAINGLRAEGVAHSVAFEAMHEAHWRNQVEADNLTDTRRAAADLMGNIVASQYGAEQRIDSIDADAHQRLASVPSRSPLAVGIITDAAAMARWTAVGAADEINALSRNFALRFGPLPQSPGRQDGIDHGDGGERPSPPTKSQAEQTSEDFGSSGRPDAPAGQGGAGRVSDSGKSTVSTSFGDERAPGPVPPVSITPASPPLRGGPPGGLPSFGGGGAISAGSSPLSAVGGIGGGAMFPSGFVSAASGGGVASAGSVGPATSPTSSSPGAALARSLPPAVPAGSFASGMMASPAPLPSTPAIAPTAQPIATTGVPPHSPVAAGPGALVAPSVSTPAAVSAGSGQPFAAAPLLPPGAMGPPPATPLTVAPAVSAGATPAGVMGPASASVTTATAVPTPVATLPSRVAAAAARDFERQRNESGDLQLVKRLAWELLHASGSGQVLAVWAVGVMYSTSGERLVVAVSNLGAGYVPAGVTVPGFLRMLWSDPLVDNTFRQRWVGWLDPAAILVAYSELKAAEPAAWRLAAAATTWTQVEALMAAAQHKGTEWATCSALTMPRTIEKEAAAARAEYAHRLACAFPELHDRVVELQRNGRGQRAARLITDMLMREARLVVVDANRAAGDSRLPANIESIWPAAAEGTVAPAERAKFAEAVQQQWLSIALVQPGWTTERSASDEVEYRARWLIARALEAVLGWITDGDSDERPALPDIVYAAAHAHLDGRGTGWISELLTQAEKTSR